MFKLLNKYKKWLIIFSFAYIYIIFMLIAPSGFYALTPGEIDATNKMYQIENVEFINDINTVSVYNFRKLTTFQKWLIEKNPVYDVREINDPFQKLSFKEQQLQGKISNDSSHNSAVIAAYEEANKVKNTILIDYQLEGLTIYDTNNSKLKIGDLIIKINQSNLNDKNYYDTLKNEEVFYGTSPSIIKSAKEYQITILRDNKEQTINLSASDLISYFPKYDIKNTAPKYQGFTEQFNVGGPSGGAMQTYSIYTALLDINLSNIKIAGTGTIEVVENMRVGEIGGLVQKFHTVKKAKVDHFFVPYSQFNQIEHLVKNVKFKVYPVRDFNEIILITNKIVSGEIK